MNIEATKDNSDVMVDLRNVDLEYVLHHDRTTSFKEFVVNAVAGRRWVNEKRTSFLALKGVNLTVRRGERVGIVGTNGAGKSTLLKVVAGILRPTRGDLRVAGTVQPLIEIGAGFSPELSGKDNVFLNGYMLGFSKKQVEEKFEEIVDFSELREFMDVPVKYYSSGMSVRLAYAIATSIEPQILALDEMLAAGDMGFVEKAHRRMDKLIQTSQCLIVVSHDLNTVERMCNRAVLIEKGTVIADGSPKDVLNEYRERSAYRE